MTRYQMLLAAGAVAVLLAGGVGMVGEATSQQKSEDPVADQLAMNCAKKKGREYLLKDNPALAVEVLEAQLPRIDGNRAYLMLLREAYRAHINKLNLNNQVSEAQKYLRRLRIIDPQLADELTVGSPLVSRPSVPVLPKGQAPSPPRSLPPTLTTPSPKAEMLPVTAALATAVPVKSPPSRPVTSKHEPTFRAKVEETPADPFALGNALEPGQISAKCRLARELVVRAEGKFRAGQFPEAHQLYNQAYQTDRQILETVKDRWAYTKLYCVVEELKKPGNNAASLAQLETEVTTALMLHPKLGPNGQQVLAQIAQRRQKVASPAGATVLEVSIKHHPSNGQGWQVAETANFLVFHRQQRDFAIQVAQVAERTRAAMLDRWFGPTAQPWRRKCEIRLHPNATEYAEATGVPAYRPGHSRIETDKSTGTVVNLRIELHCDTKDLLTAILPHETTHCILAGQFGCPTVPRWVDEGIAVLSEPTDKIDLHRRNLARLAQNQPLFGVQELMELPDYPTHNRIGAFYAQSVTLVDFLAARQGPRIFSAFVRDGVRQGYQAALQRHYGFRSFAELQAHWHQAALPGAPAGSYAQR